MAYIYKITNTINGKSYIGKTEYDPPERRWKQHIAESKKDRSSSRALCRALQKYSIEKFSFQVLEKTDKPNEREQYYIQYYNTYHNGYNETLGGDGASYLELPEQEICKYYLNHSLKNTSLYFGYDKNTIKKVLYKYNIPIKTIKESSILSKSYAVAKIDKNTNEIIQIYASLGEAEKENGNTHHIADVIHGKRQTCKGYKWKKYEEIIQ